MIEKIKNQIFGITSSKNKNKKADRTFLLLLNNIMTKIHTSILQKLISAFFDT